MTSFYVGGSFGAALGGIAWTLGGWPACAAMIAVMLAMMLVIVAFAWTRGGAPTPAGPIAAP